MNKVETPKFDSSCPYPENLNNIILLYFNVENKVIILLEKCILFQYSSTSLQHYNRDFDITRPCLGSRMLIFR